MLCLAVALWLGFAGVGFNILRASQDAPRNRHGWVDIAAYDSDGFLPHYTSLHGIFEVNSRHPCLKQILAPIVLVGSSVADKAGPEAGKKAVISVFALIWTFNFFLLGFVMLKAGASKVACLAAAALWLSFAHVWILGGIVESFGVSGLLMLGTLLLIIYGVRSARVWLGASLLAGAVTVTNGIKPVLAWLVAGDGMQTIRRIPRRTILLLVAGCSAACVLGIAFLMFKWTYVDKFGIEKGLSFVLNDIVICFPDGMTFSRRLWHIWNSFWCEPMMLHEPIVAQTAVGTPYGSLLPHVAGLGVLSLCVWSVLRHRRLPLVRAMLAMVAFDFLLHVLVGWGIEEGQIYCGHWFWIIPILVSLLPPWTALLTGGLAIAMVLHNLAMMG